MHSFIKGQDCFYSCKSYNFMGNSLPVVRIWICLGKTGCSSYFLFLTIKPKWGRNVFFENNKQDCRWTVPLQQYGLRLNDKKTKHIWITKQVIQWALMNGYGRWQVSDIWGVMSQKKGAPIGMSTSTSAWDVQYGGSFLQSCVMQKFCSDQTRKSVARYTVPW